MALFIKNLLESSIQRQQINIDSNACFRYWIAISSD
jgi:hypothetical protein